MNLWCTVPPGYVRIGSSSTSKVKPKSKIKISLEAGWNKNLDDQILLPYIHVPIDLFFLFRNPDHLLNNLHLTTDWSAVHISTLLSRSISHPSGLRVVVFVSVQRSRLAQFSHLPAMTPVNITPPTFSQPNLRQDKRWQRVVPNKTIVLYSSARC